MRCCKYVIVQALLMILCWLLLVFWAGGMLDYLPVKAGSSETPRWVRIGMLVAMATGSMWVMLRWAGPRLWTPVADRSLALLIERHNPELDNELVTAVELCGQNQADVSNPAAHAAMLERVRDSISRRADRLVLSELFNWQPIWMTATAAIFGLLMTAITAVGMHSWLSLWAERLFALSDEPWPRVAELRADGIQVQYPVFTGQLSAQRVMLPFESDTVRIPAGTTALLQISAKAENKQVPQVCTLFYAPQMERGGEPTYGVWEAPATAGSSLRWMGHHWTESRKRSKSTWLAWTHACAICRLK
ncbi:MAG: hypothetical protein R3C53_10295 [Pirellulaceae bacterium]